MNLRPKSISSLYSLFLHSAVIILSVTVFILSEQNRNLKTAFAGSDQDIAPGDTVALGMLNAINPRGNELEGAVDIVLCVMSPSCPFCATTIPQWNRLARQIGPSPQVVGVLLDSLETGREYVLRMEIEFPVFVPKNLDAFRQANGIRAVPQTIIVGSSGQVEALWKGRLTDSQVAEIAKVASSNAKGFN